MTPSAIRPAEYLVSRIPIAFDSVCLPSTPSAHLHLATEQTCAFRTCARLDCFEGRYLNYVSTQKG